MQLGKFVEAFEGFIAAGDAICPGGESWAFDVVQSALRDIAQLRLNWVNVQRLKGESWEMPTAQYPRDAHVEAFLRGPHVRTAINFKDPGRASNYARKHCNDQVNSSFKMYSRDTTVVIEKTQEIFTRNKLSGLV